MGLAVASAIVVQVLLQLKPHRERRNAFPFSAPPSPLLWHNPPTSQVGKSPKLAIMLCWCLHRATSLPYPWDLIHGVLSMGQGSSSSLHKVTHPPTAASDMPREVQSCPATPLDEAPSHQDAPPHRLCFLALPDGNISLSCRTEALSCCPITGQGGWPVSVNATLDFPRHRKAT